MSILTTTRPKKRTPSDPVGTKHGGTKPVLPANTTEAIQQFQDQLYSLSVFAWLRWPDGIKCIHCGAEDPGFLSTRQIWKCRDPRCRKQFSARRDTLLEDSPILIGDWLAVLWMVANQRGGVSSYDLKELLGVTQKTGWLMLRRIRMAVQYLHETGTPMPKRARTEAERFARLTAHVLLVSNEQLAQEEASVDAGKPLSNPFARRGADRTGLRSMTDAA